MEALGLTMVAKASNHRIQERHFPSWEGEAPAEPQKSHSGIADTDRQVANERRQDPRCQVGPAYKTRFGGNSLHVYLASPGVRYVAFRLGRSLALPTVGFARVRAVPIWHRDLSVSQLRTVILVALRSGGGRGIDFSANMFASVTYVQVVGFSQKTQGPFRKPPRRSGFPV